MATLITKLDNGKYEVITDDNFSYYGETDRIECTLEEVLTILSTTKNMETFEKKDSVSQKDLEDFREKSFEADVDL